MKALWKGQVIAQSENTVVIESNHYFPPSAIDKAYFIPSNTTTHCPWKGDAHYYSIVVDGEENTDAAWFYPAPREAAKEIAGMVAFWRGVEVTE